MKLNFCLFLLIVSSGLPVLAAEAEKKVAAAAHQEKSSAHGMRVLRALHFRTKRPTALNMALIKDANPVPPMSKKVEAALVDGDIVEEENYFELDMFFDYVSNNQVEKLWVFLAEHQEGFKEINAAIADTGDTALIIACRQGYTKIVEMLLSQNVICSTQAHDGETALMAAAKRGHVNCVRMLVERDVRTMQKNRYGQTAFDLAVHNQGVLDVLNTVDKEQHRLHEEWIEQQAKIEADKKKLKEEE